MLRHLEFEGLVQRAANFGIRPAESSMLMRAIQREFPQFNERTRLRNIEYHSVVLAETWNPPALVRTAYTIAPGLKAWLTRQRVRIHRWLVNHRYHPADRPQGWTPFFSNAGYQVITAPTTVALQQRTLDLKRFKYEFEVHDYGGGERYRNMVMLYCAYDGATDTLYYKEPR